MQPKEIADQIVFPRPTDDLPGKTIVIPRGDCNNSCASLSDGAVRADCDRQIKEFAENTRDVIRSSVPTIPPLIVKTEFDPLPNTPVTGDIFSLRQAIEFANCIGGGVTITFDGKLVSTITLGVPLPALTAPGITIDGLAAAHQTARSRSNQQRATRRIAISSMDTDPVESGRRARPEDRRLQTSRRRSGTG